MHKQKASMRFFRVILLLASSASFSTSGPVLSGREGNLNSAPSKSKHLRPVIEKRQEFAQGEPLNAKGDGGPILGKRPNLRTDTGQLRADLGGKVARTSNWTFKTPMALAPRAQTTGSYLI